MDREDRSAKDVQSEPRAGEGSRSLHTWQRLAEARRAVSGDEHARADLERDPVAYFQRHGIDAGALSGRAGLSDLEQQLSIAAGASPSLELRSEARRGCAAVVVVWAGAVAVNAVAAANAATVANVAVSANWVTGTVQNIVTTVNWAAGSD